MGLGEISAAKVSSVGFFARSKRTATFTALGDLLFLETCGLPAMAGRLQVALVRERYTVRDFYNCFTGR